jgi:hypothetical protein
VRDILAFPAGRTIATPEQLAEVLLEVIDELASEILRDGVLRAMFWHRQKGRSRLYMPNEENEFSDRIARLLAERLDSIVVRREVQLQPRVGTQQGQTPDIEAIVVLDDGTEVGCLIEVKGNWHDEVDTAFVSQLGDRYMLGPRGSTGLYLVAWYAGTSWDPDDYRLAASRRHTREDLDSSLRDGSDRLRAEGIEVTYRIIDLTLDQADVPAVDEEEEAEDVGGGDG